MEIKSISKSFGPKKIFRDVSFSFASGCYAIVGQNGIGKSVLIEMLAGVAAQDSGSIYLHGEGPSTSMKYKKKLTYIPGAPSFFPSATGEDFLRFINSTKWGRYDLLRVNKMIEEFGLEQHLRTRFTAMSLGTQKKLFLATLAMGDSKLIIMDEPTNALDDRSSKFLAKTITSLAQTAIVIVATHDQALLSNIDHVAIKLDSMPTTKLCEDNQVTLC